MLSNRKINTKSEKIRRLLEYKMSRIGLKLDVEMAGLSQLVINVKLNKKPYRAEEPDALRVKVQANAALCVWAIQ